MKIVITGGTGFIGKALTNHFLTKGYDITILTRHAEKKDDHPNLHYVPWLGDHPLPLDALEGCDAIINLADQSLNNGRWGKVKLPSVGGFFHPPLMVS